MSLERLSEPVITDLPLTEPLVSYDLRLNGVFEQFLGVDTGPLMDKMRQAGIPDDKIINTQILFSAKTFALEGGRLIRGNYGDGKIVTYVGSIIEAAKAKETTGDVPKGQTLGSLICELVSKNLAHEIQHMADDINMGQEALAAEQTRFERRCLLLGSLPEVTSSLGTLAAMCIAETAAITNNQHPVALGIGMASALICGASVVVNSLSKKMEDIRTTYKFYLKRPDEVRARNFANNHMQDLQQNPDQPLLLFRALLPGEYGEFVDMLSRLEKFSLLEQFYLSANGPSGKSNQQAIS